MAGGIKRAATVIRQMRASGKAIYIVDGDLVAGTGRQDELKAEALAEYCRSLDAKALGYMAADAKLGLGEALQLDQLSGGLLVSSSIASPPALAIAQSKPSGPFLITAVSMKPSDLASKIGAEFVDMDASVKGLIKSAQDQGLAAILMIDGGEDDARNLADKYPALALIEYQTDGDPPSEPVKVNNCTLVTPGGKGKTVVKMQFDGSHFSGYSVTHLDPEFRDDPSVARIYSRYLARVDAEDLLASVPRSVTGKFVGSSTCASCHGEAFKVWKASGHSHALQTLIGQSHGRDPDCVGCHVVGLQSTFGFRSLKSTPQFANVGCESCHGPGRNHVLDPKPFSLPKIGEKECLSCHTSDNSPGFDFGKFWPRISHR